MKKITGLLLALMLLNTIAFSQEPAEDNIQNPTFGVHFFFNDFRTAQYLRNTSLATVFNNKQFGKVKDMTPGLALNYIQGLNKYFDFTTTLSGSFIDYPKKDGTNYGQDYLLVEGDVSVRGKMFSNRYFLNPYVQAGVGVSKYKGYWGAFVPIGVGMQLNLFNEAYLIINSQYRVPVSETVNYHFYHSIGLAGNIGKKK